eukprot:Polyplicarium_translucidae@DN275_c0_g1_i2.p1
MVSKSQPPKNSKRKRPPVQEEVKVEEDVPEIEDPWKAPESGDGFFSAVKFADLPICDPLKKALVAMEMETLTEIQAKSIPRLLEGRDVLGAAKTGSGKTLAFLIPALDLLYKAKFLPRNGTGIFVITPTRELALQIHDVATDVAKFLPQTLALVIGGANRKTEQLRLTKGANVVIGTPGRLVDHLTGTKGFQYMNLLMLIIDEADRILQIGFEDEINAILQAIPKQRQSALFSATQTAKVADLARLSLNKPMLVKAAEKEANATVSGLKQGEALLFLLPSELGFLHYLRAEKVPLNEFVFKQASMPKIQTQFETIIEKNYYLHRASRDAYRSYIHAYSAHGLKDIFDVHSLDLAKVAKAFGFSAPPRVELQLSDKGDRKRKMLKPPGPRPRTPKF